MSYKGSAVLLVTVTYLAAVGSKKHSHAHCTGFRGQTPGESKNMRQHRTYGLQENNRGRCAAQGKSSLLSARSTAVATTVVFVCFPNSSTSSRTRRERAKTCARIVHGQRARGLYHLRSLGTCFPSLICTREILNSIS